MFAPRELFWTMAKYLSVNKTKTNALFLFDKICLVTPSVVALKVNVKN